MLCKVCGNTERFTMIREIASWNIKTKHFEMITDSDEYYVCDVCMAHNEEGGHIDTEGYVEVQEK